MSKVFKIMPEAHNFPTFVIPFPEASTGASLLLSADTDATIAIPSGYNVAIFSFSSGTDVWVDYNTITIPTTDSSVGGTKQLNPQGRWLEPPEGVTNLHFRCDTRAYVQVSFYYGKPIS